jgi:hypothetical protein
MFFERRLMQNSDSEDGLIHLRLTIDSEMGEVYEALLATKRRAREAIHLMRLGAMYDHQIRNGTGFLPQLAATSAESGSRAKATDQMTKSSAASTLVEPGSKVGLSGDLGDLDFSLDFFNPTA